MVVSTRAIEIKVLEKRAGMAQGVGFERNPLSEKPLHVRVCWIRAIAGNADCSAAIDDLEPLNDGCQVIAKTLAVAGHVIDGKNDYSLNTFLSDPLWGGELRRFLVKLPRIIWFIKVREPVAGPGGRRQDKLSHCMAEKEKASEAHRGMGLMRERRSF